MLDVLKNLEAFNALFKDESQRVRRLVLSNPPPAHIPKIHSSKPAKPVGIQTPAGSTVPHSGDTGAVDPEAKPGPEPARPGTERPWQDGSTGVKQQDGSWDRKPEGRDGAAATEPSAGESVNIDKPVEDKPAAGKKEEVGGGDKGDKGGKKGEGGKGESGGGDGEPPESNILGFGSADNPLGNDREYHTQELIKKGLTKDKIDAAIQGNYLKRFAADSSGSLQAEALIPTILRFKELGKVVYSTIDIKNGAALNKDKGTDGADYEIANIRKYIDSSMKENCQGIPYRVVRNEWSFQVVSLSEDQESISGAMAAVQEKLLEYAAEKELDKLPPRLDADGNPVNSPGLYADSITHAGDSDFIEGIINGHIRPAIFKAPVIDTVSRKRDEKIKLSVTEKAVNGLSGLGWNDADIENNRDELVSFTMSNISDKWHTDKTVRIPALVDASDYARDESKPGASVNIDIHNLRNVTEFLTRKGADEHLKTIMDIIRDTLSNGLPETSTVDLFKHGGDELFVTISDTPDEEIMSRTEKAAKLIAEHMAKIPGLMDIKHSKKGKDSGFGAAFHVSPIFGNMQVSKYIKDTDDLLSNYKNGFYTKNCISSLDFMKR